MLVKKARLYCEKKHKGQFRADKTTPYAKHCIEVATIITIIRGEDRNLICAGYLHDILEDTKTTYEELKNEFNEDIADLVLEVTKIGYNKYPIKTQRGAVLKFADRLSNLNDMKDWSEKRKIDYIEKSRFWKEE